VVLIHPRIVAGLGAALVFHVLELRSGEFVERPALGAVLAGGGRPVEHFAFAALELAEVSARQRRPEHAVAVDITAAGPVAGERRLVGLRERGLRRIRPGGNPYHAAGITELGSPYRAVDRVHGHAVEVRLHPLVLGGIGRRVWRAKT